jgi:LysW-gamma-L-lysine carboxypeptidase
MLELTGHASHVTATTGPVVARSEIARPGFPGAGHSVVRRVEVRDTATATAGLALLRELLEIRSPSGQEQPAVNHLVRWMTGHGFVAHRDTAGNAIGVLECAEITAKRELILLGHIDTVRGFPTVKERDGCLFGRGAVDAKGPLAAFATAAAAVGRRPGWRIVVVGAVEEESASSKGARHIANNHQPDFAVIGEPTGWQRVALGYKGRLLADVEFQRMMSHTAGPAISAPEMAFAYWQRVQGVVEELNTGRDRAWEQVQASLRHFASGDDGMLETADLRMGFRLPLSITPDILKRLLISVDGQGAFRFSGEEHAYRAEKNTPLVRAFLAAVREAGGEPGFVVKTGTSDMNVIGPAWHCPIVAYGPGDSSLDHTPNEHVSIAEWLQGVAVLTQMLRRATD